MIMFSPMEQPRKVKHILYTSAVVAPPLWCISKLKPSPIIIPINIIIHLRNFLTIGPVDTQVYE